MIKAEYGVYKLAVHSEKYPNFSSRVERDVNVHCTTQTCIRTSHASQLSEHSCGEALSCRDAKEEGV